jgi:demethylmenaquinone methyltransferase/2-methoxy-6-polyprenyl-1,4-benzoquinol methylase
VFATDPHTAAYYERRAAEYDEWYLGRGRFAERDRPGWDRELGQLVEVLRGLPAARTLDVGCGTGFLTRHLPGQVVGLDRSPAMAAIARGRLASPRLLVADALRLPVRAASFERVVSAHFYAHLSVSERTSFLAEIARVGAELLVVDSALRPGVAAEEWQWRVLNDGSQHLVYKRYLSGRQLAAELDGELLLDGTWFVAARTGRLRG